MRMLHKNQGGNMTQGETVNETGGMTEGQTGEEGESEINITEGQQ